MDVRGSLPSLPFSPDSTGEECSRNLRSESSVIFPRSFRNDLLPSYCLIFFLFLLSAGVCSAGVRTEKDTPAPQVRLIQFKGVHSVPVSDLKKLLATKEKRFKFFGKAPLEDEVLQKDLDLIVKYYQSRGFYHARVVSHRVVPLVGRNVRVEIEIEEGAPMLVSEIVLRVDGSDSGPWHEALGSLMALQPGERFTTPGYQDTEKKILRYLGDWGSPKARVEMKAILNKQTNRARVEVEVQTGPVCYVGDIIVEGNETISDRVILRELTFKKGDRYSVAKISESQQRLFNLDLFQFVDLLVEDMETEGSVILPIRILVKEAKKQTVKVGAGYGTEDEFRGQVQYEIRDFLGDGRRLQVNAKGSSLVQFLEGRLLQPHMFDPRSNLVLTGGVKREDQESFENQKLYVSPLLNYKWSESFSSHIGYNLETNRLLEVDLTRGALGPVDDENQEYYVASLVLGNALERVDNALNPRKGWRLLQNIEWASVGLGSEVDFFKLVLEGRGYLPLWKNGVLAGKLKWGGIQKLENTRDIPIFKRFFAGGSESVRGYPYQRLGPLDRDGNPIGGMTLVEGSLEWRFPIRGSIEGVFFFDFGSVYDESFHLGVDDLRYTGGCGVRYLTPVGPLRLDIGYQLNPPDQDFFNPYQFHFSIGQAF